MATAILLGGFVAPLFAFLGSAFVAAAIRERFEGRRRAVVATARQHRRAF